MTKTRPQPRGERQEHNVTADDYKLIMSMGKVEKESLLIMMECMTSGGTYTEAAEAAAAYLFSQPGHEAQARATLALGEQWAREGTQKGARK